MHQKSAKLSENGDRLNFIELKKNKKIKKRLIVNIFISQMTFISQMNFILKIKTINAKRL